MSTPLKIIFAGTPEFAASHLQVLIDSEHQVIAVYTKQDSPAGRGKKLQASAVKQLALEHDIAVYQPKSLKKQPAQQELAELGADLMVVVAYGLILPQVALDTPRLGCINVHGSILPRWRGAAPFQRAIWAGDSETGVTIMQMNIGLDTGDILSVEKCPIEADETSSSLYYKIAQTGPLALIKAVDNIAAGNINPQKQDDEQATYAKKLSKEEALMDWQLSATELERCVRAFNPWPVSYIVVNDNGKPRNVKIWQAHVADETTDAQPGTVIAANKRGIRIATADNQVLTLTSLQPPGKKPMAAVDFINARVGWFSEGAVVGIGVVAGVGCDIGSDTALDRTSDAQKGLK
ncbi:MAG: methionyl-tRNA formyltransferase [Algicola sp.]|nr:methionyl-tRNA formyltransferase [Algicola sp.]